MLRINQIYCMDNIKGMQLLDDDCIDLTVTSPPYDDMRKYKEHSWDFGGIAKELWRITKVGGVVVWIVGDKKCNGTESGSSFIQALYFKELGFNLHDTMIYRKINGAMGSLTEYLQEFEFMFVLSKGNPKTANLLRDRKNVLTGDKSTPKRKSDKNGSRPERHTIVRAKFGRRKNIWEYAVGGRQETGRHPAIFPEQLAEDHILSWSNENDLILDPFLGSGTTAKMAHLNKRNYIGFEVSLDYCCIANERLVKCFRKAFTS